MADIEALIAWSMANAPDVAESSFSAANKTFDAEFFAKAIRAVGPDYWR